MKDYIQGLLENPTFNLGVGLLQSSGPRPITTGFGDVLAGGIDYANTRQAQAMQMNAARDRIAAQKELGGLLGGNPEGRLINAMIQSGNPQLAASYMNSMTPQMPRLSPEMNEFIMMNPGLQPGSPEFQSAYTEYKGQDTEAIVQQLEIENLIAERQMNQAELAEKRGNQAATIGGTIDTIRKMKEIIPRLEGTPLEPGTPGADAVIKNILAGRDWFADLTGIGDPNKYSSVIADFNEFTKLSNTLNIGSYSSLAGLPRSTQALQMVSDSQPGPNLDPIANTRVLDSLEEEFTSMADRFNELYPESRVITRNRKPRQEQTQAPQITPQQIQQYLNGLSEAELKAIINE